ncbi:hypothetical protein GCWU000324_02973 [Kingella oralis ATCC 51147]|uniref:Uncharacterized protein n=1 Tax=Kingella oralis ATCC 51147 TaxID=629741 RepID=C4GMN8_9NEIS|nr:hypothetical protein GCWU000324_02973 [Kingella oralis ATCC 51147]
MIEVDKTACRQRKRFFCGCDGCAWLRQPENAAGAKLKWNVGGSPTFWQTHHVWLNQLTAVPF